MTNKRISDIYSSSFFVPVAVVIVALLEFDGNCIGRTRTFLT